jgi:uncharacterized repeat protein (TIGR03803 family)
MVVSSEIDRKHVLGSRLAAPWTIFCLAFIFLVISGFRAAAQTFTFQQVAAFTNAPPGSANPANPAGGLVQDAAGGLYGTSFAGGNYGLGSVFAMDTSGDMAVLASFNGSNGANPRGTMLIDSSLNLYGVTYGGGRSNAGTIFKITNVGFPNVTVLHDFYADPGQNPYAGLMRGADGNFYGTTESYSTVFRITPSGVFSNLTTSFGMNGQTLDSLLAQGSGVYGGNLYGVAGLKGFSAQGGAVLSVVTNGTQAGTFAAFGGSSGDKPFSGLVPWGSNSYVGTAAAGGAYGMGTLFFVTNAGATLSPGISFNGTNGAYPYAPPLVVGSNIYGGTAAGGAYGQGVLFKYNVKNGTLATTSLAGTNGSGVYGQMILGKDGYIYGTTRFGGAYARGTVFRMDTNGNLTTISSFGPPAVLQQLYSGVIQAADGNYYGVTIPTSANGFSTIYQLAPGGALSTFATVINYYNGVSDSAVMQANDGNFYATAYSGGDNNQGAVIRITPAGSASIIFSFNGSDGANPFAGLIQGSDGLLYGTTVNGGPVLGTVFGMTTNGVLQTGADFGGTRGANPYAPLIQGQDGAFYGTAYAGGTNNLGTVFRFTSDGLLTGLYSFSGPDGANPRGGLIQGADGFLYGTTTYGGITNGSSNSAGFGTVFQISTNGGAINTLAYFNGTNGANPVSSLILGPDGNFYGTTPAGGADNDGTVFSVGSGGVLTTIYSFSGADGAAPYAGLFFGSDGALYGVTTAGGSDGDGNIFRIAQPVVLQISAGGGLVQIAWPAFDSEFQLESSGDLSDPNGWSPVLDAQATNNGQVIVLQAAPTNNAFYRLVKP